MGLVGGTGNERHVASFDGGKPTELRSRDDFNADLCAQRRSLFAYTRGSPNLHLPPVLQKLLLQQVLQHLLRATDLGVPQPYGLPDALTLALARPRHGPQEASEAGALT